MIPPGDIRRECPLPLPLLLYRRRPFSLHYNTESFPVGCVGGASRILLGVSICVIVYELPIPLTGWPAGQTTSEA